jgi:membrane protease subunit (stomatin/prohibitin family)
MRAANAAIAQGEALKAAASNEAGAMMGFAGINMMQGAAGAMNASGLYDTSQPYQQPTNAYQVTSPAEGWTCPSCGTTNTSKFCMECGSPKPAPAAAWTCPNCGASNTGKFCSECGTPKPVDETWTCPKCGASNKG